MLVICMSACDQDISIKTNNTGADITKLTFQCIDNMSYAVSINGSFAQIKDSIGRYKTCGTPKAKKQNKPAKAPNKPSTSNIQSRFRRPGESIPAWRKRLMGEK